MTTATLLNGQLYTEGYIVALIYAYQRQYVFPFPFQETFVLKSFLLLSTPAYTHPIYRLLRVGTDVVFVWIHCTDILIECNRM